MSLEEKMNEKLENGEITQEEYDSLMNKLGGLDLLSAKVDQGHRHSHRNKRKWRVAGSSHMEGQDVDEPVKVSGRLTVDGDLKCPSLRIAGHASIDGNLTVLEETKTSGQLSITGEGKFGGPVKISGKMNVDKSAYFTDILKISGKLNTGGDVISGADMKVSGKVDVNSLQSKSTVRISGKIKTNENLVAEEFVSSGGRSQIGGSINAKRVEIATKHRLRQETNTTHDENIDDIDSLPDLGRFISNVVKNIIPNVMNSFGGGNMGIPGIFTVENNIEGEIVDISYTHVKGDIVANEVMIGPGVTIDGVIKYRSSIEVPEDTEYTSEQVE